MWKGVINKPIAVPNDPAARKKKCNKVSSKPKVFFAAPLRLSFFEAQEKYQRLRKLRVNYNFFTAGNTSEYNI